MINLTPHEISIVVNGNDMVFPPSGVIALVSTTETVVGVCPVTGANLVVTEYGEVEGLPESDVPCLVSAMVLDRVVGRKNIFAPDTGKTAIRNEKGHIVAVTQLKVPS